MRKADVIKTIRETRACAEQVCLCRRPKARGGGFMYRLPSRMTSKAFKKVAELLRAAEDKRDAEDAMALIRAAGDVIKEVVRGTQTFEESLITTGGDNDWKGVK